MEKEFIPYELAVKLKELGFDGECFGWYAKRDSVRIANGVFLGNHSSCSHELGCYAPLWQQAFDWFRGEDLHSWIYQSNRYSFHYTILKDGRYAKNGSDTIHYQEARQACLEKLIELISK